MVVGERAFERTIFEKGGAYPAVGLSRYGSPLRKSLGCSIHAWKGWAGLLASWRLLWHSPFYLFFGFLGYVRDCS